VPATDLLIAAKSRVHGWELWGTAVRSRTNSGSVRPGYSTGGFSHVSQVSKTALVPCQPTPHVCTTRE
jgi:hypothetical protein